MKVKLIKLTKEYEKQLGEMIDEWKLDQQVNHTDYYLENLELKEPTNGFVPDSVFFLLDEERNRLVGAVNIRHYLNEHLLNYGGHIGDGVRPSERRKGYATEMLKQILPKCKAMNINRVLLACDKENIGSAKTIIANGGVLENEVIDEVGLSKSGTIQRYWISLKKRYADRFVGNRANADLRIISISDDYFSGDIYFYKFIDVKDKILIPNGKCIMDNNYKWLEFYDYSSKVKLTAIYDENSEIIEWYFDIARKIGKDNGIPYEDDLYLDVVVTPSGDVILLDEDELKEAFNKREMTREEFENAYKEAEQLMNKLKNNKDKLKEYTDKYLFQMLGGSK